MRLSVTRALARQSVICAVLLVACNRQPASPIQGRWKEVQPEPGRTVEFKRNGDVLMSDEDAGKYRLLDSDHLELRGAALRSKWRFEIAADHLRLEPEGEGMAPREYERIK